jgi:hypothetical protein
VSGSNRDPEKRAAKRRARREAIARGSVINPRERQISASQASHASSGKAIKKRRHGERAIEREREND